MSYWFARAWHIIGTVLIYGGSATLTFLFFQDITPPGLWWFPVAAIGLLEFGIIHWSSYHREVAENAQQAVVSVCMITVSVVGVAVSTGFELVRMLAATFGLQLGWMNYALWLIVFIFPINILGNQLCKLLSNEHIELWQMVFERSGERAPLRPIKIGRFFRRKEQLKDATPVDDRKQLDGPTEEMEEVSVSNFSAEAPPSVKKKLPPVKQDANKLKRNLSSTVAPGNQHVVRSTTESR